MLRIQFSIFTPDPRSKRLSQNEREIYLFSSLKQVCFSLVAHWLACIWYVFVHNIIRFDIFSLFFSASSGMWLLKRKDFTTIKNLTWVSFKETFKTLSLLSQQQTCVHFKTDLKGSTISLLKALSKKIIFKTPRGMLQTRFFV